MKQLFADYSHMKEVQMKKALFPHRTSVALPDELYQMLIQLSDKNETSIGDEIRKLMLAGLKQSNETTERS